jgi:hypothetical protein
VDTPAAAAIVGLTLLTAGCLSVEAEAPEVLLTRTALPMAPATPLPGGLRSSLTVRIDSPYDPVELPDGLTTELRPQSLTLLTTRGLDDLTVIEAFQVRLGSSADGAPPPTLLFDRQAPFDFVEGPFLRSTTNLRPNVMDYWTLSQTWYELTVVGQLPDYPWMADLTVNFSGQVSYSP